MTDTQQPINFDPNSCAYRMAVLMKALEDLELEKVEYVTEWKDRKVKLENQLRELKYEVLSGQKPLFAEVPVAESGNHEPASPTEVPVHSH